MSEKYFYIAVPKEMFHEVKHAFYEAPSSYLKVYEGDYVWELERQISALMNENIRLREALDNGDVEEPRVRFRMDANGNLTRI